MTRPSLRVVRCALAAALFAGFGAALSPAATAATKAKASKQAHVAHSTLAYDLVSSNGTVTSFGHARNFGGAEDVHLNAPIVGIAPTPDGRGYWLVAKDGGVFSYGDAHFYGSLGADKLTSAHYIVAIVPTVDGKGYWLCDASGDITAFGDAPALPSLRTGASTKPIVGFSVLHDQKGAWVVNSAGVVYHLGQTRMFGSLAGKTISSRVVGMAGAVSGGGYWLAEANGDVVAFGNAATPTPPKALKGSIVSITPAAGGSAYWAASSTGYVVPSGVPSLGGLAVGAGDPAIVAIATTTAVPLADPGTYAAGSVGYDVNWPQCSRTGSTKTGTMPGPPKDPSGTSAYSIAIVGVDGWAIDDDNSCLGAEVTWADKASEPDSTTVPPYQLYMFLNSPASSSTIDLTGPAGTCASLAAASRPACLAYNYGYNAALDAVSYASSEDASSSTWWLDIENSSCASGEWNDAAEGEWWSCEPSLNDQTIQGALDALREDKVTAGVYSTSVQWDAITDDYVPTGGALPLWIAGAPWTSPPYPASDHYLGTSALTDWCSGSYDFAGGSVELLQETPGDNNYPFDPDYAC